MSAAELLERLGGTGQLRDKCRGALVGTAVGDGLGQPFEGHQGPVSSRQMTLVELDDRQLRHTDDTAMTMALAESLLYTGDLDQDHLAATFARCWEREPDRGYGGGTASLLAHICAGVPWKEAAESQFDGQGSFGNGAAMRVAPVALWACGDTALAAEAARRSAVVTHTHPLGVDGAAVQASAVAAALAHPLTQPLDRAAFLAQVRAAATQTALAHQLDVVASLLSEGTAHDVATQVGTGIEAHEAVPAAICSFLCHPDSFGETIRFAIGLGGDTDTIAAMAGAISGAFLGERAIPRPWAERTEAALGRCATLADRFVHRMLPGHDPA
ncbi:MAG: ADP-ribosylglycohydrolase family protein [Acidimicrobiales bacterium]